MTADSLIKKLALRDGLLSSRNIIGILSESGIEIHRETSGNSLIITLTGPFAEHVHPCLETENTICPLAQIVLGMIRTRHRKSITKSSRLTRHGSILNIELSADDTRGEEQGHGLLKYVQMARSSATLLSTSV